MICALVQNDIVVDCPVELTDEQIQDYAGRFQAVVSIEGLDPSPKKGWHYVNGSMIDPDNVGSGGVALITNFAFYNRFTPTERATFEGFMDAGPPPYKYVARDFKTSISSAMFS